MASNLDIREWRQLPYYDPEPLLVALAEVAADPRLHDLPYEVSSLRTRELRPFHERRLGAIFFYLMGKVQQNAVTFAHVERADYDFVAHYKVDDEHHFVPVQMKELVPERVNSRATLQGVIDALRLKYVDSKDLAVAISINRIGTIVPKELDFSGLALGGLWLFGSTKPDQSTWLVLGDMLREQWTSAEIDYPRGPAQP